MLTLSSMSSLSNGPSIIEFPIIPSAETTDHGISNNAQDSWLDRLQSVIVPARVFQGSRSTINRHQFRIF